VFGSLAGAQTCADAVIFVTVHDSGGAPVEAAGVELNREAAQTGSQRTDALGVARFERLPCGTYVVRVSKPGFDEVATEKIQVSGTTPLEVAVVLTAPTGHRDSVDVHDTAGPSVQESSASEPLGREVAKDLPSRPPTVADALPVLPGVVRAPDGSLKIDSSGEHRNALLINKTDVTDPATGIFGQTVPVDSIEEVNVLKTPFMAQYGRFTAGVVSVETRRGGDEWHSELNDPFPDYRFRSWHMTGVRDASPRGVLSGPVIANRLYFAETILYDIRKTPNKTLPYPDNESKKETYNSFTQIDYILSPKQVLTGTLHITPLKINFVNPDYFMPQPVTPSYHQQEFAGTIIDHLTVGSGMLTSTLAFQRFDANVGSQGPGEMTVTPTGNAGNYFSNQNREAGRYEWLETWSPAERHLLGRHGVEFGTAIAATSNVGELTARPVNLLDPSGILLRRITYTGGEPYDRADVDSALFAQDHWTILPNLALDIGSRFERQTIAETFRIAPRAGLAWTPFGTTVFRAGYGVFYDRVPLNVYSFERYPQQVIADYAAGGSMIGNPLVYENVIGTAYFNGSLLIHSPNEPGNFAPHSSTWNLQLERAFSRYLKLRATYTDSDSAGLILMHPEVSPGGESAALVLNGNGHAKYRQAEVSARVNWSSSSLFLAYTRSKAEGDLNDFGGFLGNFPGPVIRPNLYSLLPSDLPNRFLAWGQFVFPYGIRMAPMVEYRNGFPYASYDVLGNYVGTPYQNDTRYPDSFSLDARVSKDFKVNAKYTVRLSVGATNLTNHFNALAVHSNYSDPQYGIFFGNYNRRFLADFDILF
jgi:hypothetical protein